MYLLCKVDLFNFRKYKYNNENIVEIYEISDTAFNDILDAQEIAIKLAKESLDFHKENKIFIGVLNTKNNRLYVHRKNNECEDDLESNVICGYNILMTI